MKYWLLLLLLLLPSIVCAAQLKRIQTNELTLGTTVSSVNDTIAYVDITKSILVVNMRQNDDTSSGDMIRCSLSATQVTCQRNLAASVDSTHIRYYVLEFKDGVSVQRGSSAIVGANFTVAISPVNMSSSFMVSGGHTGGGGTFNTDEFIQLTLLNTTAVSTITAGGSQTIDWQVVTYTNASVQRGFAVFSTGTSILNVSINPVTVQRSAQ
jgi:hypothetical protein